MFEPYFEGLEYSYSFDCDTGCFSLKKKSDLFSVVLKGDDAFMFKEHLELIMIEQNNTLKERIEKVIKIHIDFNTNPCLIPHFIE